MEQPELPTEICLSDPPRSLGHHYLDGVPQPGAFVEVGGQTYTVLERHHRYQLKTGRYQLHKVALYVQPADGFEDRHFVNGRWIVGTATCRFNAHSEMLRCAINPLGPCQGCHFFEPLESTAP